MNFQDLNLSYNPFKDITPSRHSSNLIWAGMHEVKTKFERLYKACLHTDAKEIVLNWGPYGGGKTFSAYYFIHNNSSENLTQIYLRNPKEGTKATREFFRSIIDELTFQKIHDQISEIISKIELENFINILTPIASREYAKAISLIGSSNEDEKSLMNRFVYSGLTKTELKKLGLAKDIQSDSDLIKFLAGLISCFNDDRLTDNGKVILWIDEMEDLIYFQPKYYKSYSQILRDLFDSISSNFLVFLNFTLAEGEETTIEIILGNALWSRITKRIRLKPFSIENGKDYILELLKASKITEDSVQPFSDQIAERLISVIPLVDLTPRQINRHAGDLLNYAIENNVHQIDNSLFDRWQSQHLEDD